MRRHRAFVRWPEGALKGVTLDVHRGEIFGLVGPNGSGKTSMVNVVTGFYPPNAGSVTLFGKTLPVWRHTLSRVAALPVRFRTWPCFGE
jgi:ABC-type multidrug transport system ATPase subunit